LTDVNKQLQNFGVEGIRNDNYTVKMCGEDGDFSNRYIKWSGPEGSRKLRFPEYVTMAKDGSKVDRLTHRPLFTPRKYSCYSFLLEAESTPGP